MKTIEINDNLYEVLKCDSINRNIIICIDKIQRKELMKFRVERKKCKIKMEFNNEIINGFLNMHAFIEINEMTPGKDHKTFMTSLNVII